MRLLLRTYIMLRDLAAPPPPPRRRQDTRNLCDPGKCVHCRATLRAVAAAGPVLAAGDTPLLAALRHFLGDFYCRWPNNDPGDGTLRHGGGATARGPSATSHRTPHVFPCSITSATAVGPRAPAGRMRYIRCLPSQEPWSIHAQWTDGRGRLGGSQASNGRSNPVTVEC